MKGLTLIELLISLTIISLMTLMAIPLFSGFISHQEKSYSMDRLNAAIEYARTESMRRRQTISLCGSHDRRTCHHSQDWSTGWIVFENKRREDQPRPDSILATLPGIRSGKITFYANSPLLNIRGTGMNSNFGRFVYCAKTKINPSGLTLVINAASRTYLMPADCSPSQ